MVYDDAEKLYAEVRADAEAVVDNALCVLYPGSALLSSVATASASAPLTVFAHNTTPFPRRDIVRVPLTEGRISSGNVLQTTSDGKEGYVVLEGGAGGGLVLPSQLSAKDLSGAQIFIPSFWSLSLSHARNYVMQVSRCIVRTANRSCWGMGLSSLPSLEGGLPVYSTFDSSASSISFRHFLGVSGIPDACVGDNYRRELIPQGQTGGLVIFEDHPNYWDAWGASRCTHTYRLLLLMGWNSGVQMSRYITWRRDSDSSSRRSRSSSLAPCSRLWRLKPSIIRALSNLP